MLQQRALLSSQSDRERVCLRLLGFVSHVQHNTGETYIKWEMLYSYWQLSNHGAGEKWTIVK